MNIHYDRPVQRKITPAKGIQQMGFAAVRQVGDITFDPVTWTAESFRTYTSTGGTGRLADATETFSATAHFTLL